MSAPRCLRCGAGAEWLAGRVPSSTADERRQAYNAKTMGDALTELVQPIERERLDKIAWARSLVNDLVKRVINLRLENESLRRQQKRRGR